jgi:two-component system response regulator WspF
MTIGTVGTASLWSEPDGPTAPSLVAIGVSAGGPPALSTLLRGLPGDFPGAVVIVQHADAPFALGVAAWLREQTGRRVRVAVHGDRVEAGTVLLAGRSEHLVFTSADVLGYASEPYDAGYRPSIDVFFNSVINHWRGAAVGVILTGMGGDGAAGLKAMRTRGLYTIAQDEASSAVYGMPKAAAAIEAAVDVLPLSVIAPRLVEALAQPANRCVNT